MQIGQKIRLNINHMNFDGIIIDKHNEYTIAEFPGMSEHYNERKEEENVQRSTQRID